MSALYKAQQADFRSDRLCYFEKKTHKTAPPSPELEALSRALEGPDDELVSRVEALVDLDAYFRFWATEALLNDWDSWAIAADGCCLRSAGREWGSVTFSVAHGAGIAAYDLRLVPLDAGIGRARHQRVGRRVHRGLSDGTRRFLRWRLRRAGLYLRQNTRGS